MAYFLYISRHPEDPHRTIHYGFLGLAKKQDTSFDLFCYTDNQENQLCHD